MQSLALTEGLSPVNLTIYSEPSVFEQLRSEWNDLLQRSPANNIFSTWEWTSTWWQAYQPGELWVIACRDDQQRLIGIAPWFIREDAQDGRMVHTIGCIDVTDYLDIIVDGEHLVPVYASLARCLGDSGAHFQQLDLCNIPEASPTYTQFPDILRQHGFTVTLTEDEVCPVIQLPASWEAYLESLDKKNRHELRRKLRRSDGAGETLDWYIVNSSHNLEVELERFMQLMAKSSGDKAQFLQDTQNAAFFKHMVHIAAEKGWLELAFLTANGVPAAAYLNFVYDERVLVYNSGLDAETFGQLSPGIVLVAYIIQYAIEQKRRVFDFLRGNEVYKYRLGGKDTRVYRLNARKDTQ